MDFFSVDVIAILATLGMSTMSIINRLGFRTGTPFMAVVVINSTVLLLYMALSTYLGVSWTEVPRTALLWFVVAGVCSPGLSLTFYYVALDRYGIARAAPISMGSSPLFSVLVAVAFLGERPHWLLYVGTLLIVGGIWVVSHPRADRPTTWKELALPLGGGFFWGLAATFRKLGLQIVPVPHIAVVIQNTAALALFLAIFWTFPRGRRLVASLQALKFFVLAGVTLSVTFYFLFTALARGEVSRVMAILGATPLLTVLLAAIFLGKLEQITPKIYAGAISIVTGVILITILRG